MAVKKNVVRYLSNAPHVFSRYVVIFWPDRLQTRHLHARQVRRRLQYCSTHILRHSFFNGCFLNPIAIERIFFEHALAETA